MDEKRGSKKILIIENSMDEKIGSRKYTHKNTIDEKWITISYSQYKIP